MSGLSGSLDVLNISAGHLHIDFDKNDPADTERAKRIIGDMLKRGYSLFVETEDGLQKVKRFDPATESYVIVDGPTENTGGKRGGYKTKPMRGSKATGVGPTAGG